MHHPEDMSTVADWGELLPEEWFHVRFNKITEKDSSESKEPTAYFTLIIQNEPFVGRTIPDNASLQSHALAKLKKYYISTGVPIIPGQGHDPDNLKDRECWVKVTHTTNKGEKRMSIAPHHIRSLEEGKPIEG